jgi:hypothetical protein
MDTRRVAIYEKFSGQPFQGVNGNRPTSSEALILDRNYSRIFEGMYAGLMVQTHLKDLYDQITYSIDPVTQEQRGDLTAPISEIRTRLDADPVAGR